MQDSKIEISKIKRKKRHFPQIVEDCVSDCQRLSSARTRTRNSFSSFNPPLTEDLDLDLLEAARRIIQIPKMSSFYS